MVERTRSVRKSGSSRALGSSSHHSTSTPAKENNPIKTDAELNILVNSKLQSIEKYKTFQRWKGKFLERFETFLYQKGMDPAQKEADALQETLLKLTKQTAKVLDYIDKNELSQDKKTVKASLALNEMCNTLEEARKELQGLIPSLKAEERKLGYSKFHLGSVLIQQNFPQYVLMETVRNDLASIGKTMEEVLDRQQHDAFGHYNKQVVRFCDIMADLDMYEIMKKCIRFRNPPDESESEDPVEMEVHIVNTDENDEQITIEMLETDTIAMLQEMIAIGFESLKPDRQVLTYKGSTVSDTPTKTLLDLGVQNGDKMFVKLYKMPLTIKLFDDSMPPKRYEVDPTDFVSTLQRKCAPDFIPASNQQLFLNDQPMEVTNRIQDYANPNDVIILEPKMIDVKAEMADGKIAELKLCFGTDTLEDIKKRIETATFMPIEKQVIYYHQAPLASLKDDGKTKLVVREMGLRNGDTLQVQTFTIPIIVECWDGKIIETKIDPDITLGQLKLVLKDVTDIEPGNQILSTKKDNKTLKENATSVKDHGVIANDVLQLEPMSFSVDLAMPDGSKAQVMVSPNDDADTIKRKIEDTTGMKAPRQVLKDMAGKELPSGKTAKEMGLREGTPLKVEIFKIPVKVQTWDDKTVDLMVEPCETLSDIKKMLEPDSGIAADNQVISKAGDVLQDDAKTANDLGIVANDVLQLEPMSFNVDLTMPDGSKAQVMLSPNDDSFTIKRKIEGNAGIDANRLRLCKDGMELPNAVSAKKLGLREGDCIDVGFQKIQVKVICWNRPAIDLLVEPLSSVSSLKDMLAVPAAITPKNQNLRLDGIFLAEDAATLTSCGIKKGAELHLEPFYIACHAEMPDGAKHDLLLPLLADFNKVKDLIEDVSGLGSNRQVVKNKGRKLPENSEMQVRDMGIRDGDILNVSINAFPITVNCYGGRTIHILIEPSQKLIDVKRQLEAESGIAAKNQRLSLGDKEFAEDSKTTAMLGISPQRAVLDLEPLSVQVNCIMPDQTTHGVDLYLSDDTDAIKHKIAAATGMVAPRQIVRHRGVILPESGKTVKTLGIYEGTTLAVEVLKVPLYVNIPDGRQLKLMFDLTEPLAALKEELVTESGVPISKQLVSMCGGDEFIGDTTAVSKFGVVEGSILDLEIRDDPIVFVDCKYGTMFALQREEAIESGVFTLNQGNPYEFVEIENRPAAKEKMAKSMLESTNLGVKPQVVVDKTDVEDYDVAEAEAVKNKWGVALKKTSKNQKGNEFLFVDVKTDSVGYLDRQKLMETKFITVVGFGKSETLEQAEKDQQRYDYFVREIRRIFRISSAK